jgi:hypothetical protein
MYYSVVYHVNEKIQMTPKRVIAIKPSPQQGIGR